MPTQQDGEDPRSRAHQWGTTGGIRRKFVWTSGVLAVFLTCSGTTLRGDAPTSGTAAAVDQAVAGLLSPDAAVRFQSATALMTAPAPRAAVPLAQAVLDPVDDVQMAAIAAELNIFLAEKLTPKKRIGLIIEPKNRGVSEAAFLRGAVGLGAQDVPLEVLSALRSAVADETPRVAIEALYAFGTLGADRVGADRTELLRAATGPLNTALGQPAPTMRLAAVRVAGRLFQKRPSDEQVDERLGDGLIAALNDADKTIKLAAMDALGAMRYTRALPALGELLAFYKKGDMAEGTLDAVARIAQPESAGLLAAQLLGSDPALKATAIEGLARLGQRSSLPAIQKAVENDRTERVQMAGTFAAVLLAEAPADLIAEGLIRARLHDQAFRYMVEIAPSRTSTFLRFAHDPDERMRVEIAEILGQAGDPAALSILERLTADTDAQVVAAAKRATARLNRLAQL